MIGNFSEESQFILLEAKSEMINLGHPYIGTEHLLLSILKNSIDISDRVSKYNLSYESFKNELVKIIGTTNKNNEYFLYTPLLRKVIDSSIADSREYNNGEVSPELLFFSILEEGEGIAIRIMIGMGIDVGSLYDEFSFSLIDKSKKSIKKKKLLISELGYDLTYLAKNGNFDPVVGRDKEIKRLMEILCRRNKNNPILIGEAGVGKTAIVEELANLISSSDVPNLLLNKRIISLDMASIVAGTKYRGEFEERMKKIVKEAEDNDDIILFIDEIHTLVGAGGAEGAIDASNILKPALARGKIRCIGATTNDEYKKYFEKDSALERRFQKIFVNEPSVEETKSILLELKPIYEKYHNVVINDCIIDYIISMSERYIFDRNRPDKEIDILDEVCSMVGMMENDNANKIKKIRKEINSLAEEKNSFIIDNDINMAYNIRKKETKLLSLLNKTELLNNEFQKKIYEKDVSSVIKNRLGNYKNLCINYDSINNQLKKVIIGQDNVIDKFINSIKRFNFDLDSKCYSALFVGPSGVGKTELIKQFSSMFTADDCFIRLDMSEYSDSSSVNKFLGSSPGFVGYDDNKCILDIIRSKSNFVLLLDEIDKAHPSVINLFYQILDEGKIRSSNGNIVRFNNVFIIMTSNVGFQSNKIGFNSDFSNNHISNLNNFFSTSFINRISNIFTFNSLNEKNISDIILNKFEFLKEKYSDINLNINNNVVDEIISFSNFKEYGARKINKLLFNYIECYILDCLANNANDVIINSLADKKTILL